MTQPLGMSMYGAVDLSSLASQGQAADGRGGAGGSVHGEFVVDVDAQNLQSLLETSSSVPVVLVFTSPRSEASGSLDSQLQALAQRHGGRFQLGRVDTDASPEVAQAFRITGVPAAAALIQGQPIPLFEGVPAAQELDGVIDQLLATAQQYGMTGVLDGDGAPAPEPELPEHHRAALDAMGEGDFARAVEEFEAALKANPGSPELAYGLAQAELMVRVDGVDPNAALAAVEEAPAGDVEAQMAAADVEVAYGRPAAAFARLIEAVKVTSGKERETVRKRLVSLFDVVGSAEPIVAQVRRDLASALF